MLRSIVFLILSIPWTLFWAGAMSVMSWHPRRIDIGQTLGHIWARGLVIGLGLKLDVDLGGVERGKTYVFMVNHSSYLDIPILICLLRPNRILFVAKKSLFFIPVFGWALKGAGHISIDRANRREGMKSLQEAVDKAKLGYSPLIFPEGTRNPDPDRLLDFKTGGMILALKCGLPVVPLVLRGTADALPKHGKLPRTGTRITVRALDLVSPDAFTLKERERFKDHMYETMNRSWQELAHAG